MNENSTKIDYAGVDENINSINDSKNKMSNLLDDFNGSMNRATATDVFDGIAGDQEREKYKSFSSHYDEYLDLVNRFATEIKKSSDATAATETQLKETAAEDLKE